MRKLVIWTVGLAILAAASLTIAAWAGLIDAYGEATLFLAGVAAVAAVAGSLITWLGNRTNAQHLHELAVQQQQAAADIRRLAELTESSLEEARAQKPEPVVQFIVGKEQASAGGAIYTRKRFARSIQVEKVAQEREAALATLPAETTLDDDVGATSRRPRLSPAILAAITGLESGPITSEERSTFQRRVDGYASELRKWLRSYERYRQLTDLAFPIFLRFENRGRVPAKGVRVRLRFPDGFANVDDLPGLDRPPRRPRFQRRRFGISGLDRALTTPDYSKMLLDPPVLPGRRNVSRPRFRDGSLIVELDIENLRHGVSEELDEPIWLTVDPDGEFVIPWEVHAENLGEPAGGELVLQVVTELEEGEPITSLDELPELARRDEEDAGD